MNTRTASTAIDSIVIEAADPAAAERFYADAFGLGRRLRVRAADSPSTGFRGFMASLLVSQPAAVRRIVDAAVAAGGTLVKPAAKSMWGFGGVVQAPDGSVWKIATAAKKDTGPDTGEIDRIVLLIGADDILASKRFYVEQGFSVGKSFGRSYVEFANPEGAIQLGLYRRGPLAKDAGVPAEGSGSHRLVLVGGRAAAIDPDGFEWEPAEH
ncbi:glyoxalase [Agromyces italicus]|uniref:glyoxalase n=1 Tax=Agromyces italicus TaxID=279572 RepID=UPI00047B0838|nr:glyoxalase [Agromyces italicus]